MSIESARAFIERMKTDEDFRTKVNMCKDSEERKSCVFKEGFEFKAEELKLARAEISDGELDMVVGGGSCDIDWSGACGWMLFDLI